MKDLARFPRPGATLPMTKVHMTGFNAIPEMTDPLGKHWDQPANIREFAMNQNYVWMTQAQMKMLPEYSSTMPSGCYEGKCWMRFEEGVHHLMWYYDTPELKERKKIGIAHREIILEEL